VASTLPSLPFICAQLPKKRRTAIAKGASVDKGPMLERLIGKELFTSKTS